MHCFNILNISFCNSRNKNDIDPGSHWAKGGPTVARQKSRSPNWSKQVSSMREYSSLQFLIFLSFASAIPQICAWQTNDNGVTTTFYKHGSTIDARNFDDVICLIARYDTYQAGLQYVAVDIESLTIADGGKSIPTSVHHYYLHFYTTLHFNFRWPCHRRHKPVRTIAIPFKARPQYDQRRRSR